jgi:hypothetical protein
MTPRAVVLLVWIVLMAAMSSNSALSQITSTATGNLPPPGAQPGGTLEPGGVGFTPPANITPDIQLQLSPRFWYFFGTGGYSKSPTITQAGSNAQFEFPMTGIVGALQSTSLPNTTFLLSVLYGETTLSSNAISVVPATSSANAADLRLGVNRYDFELLAQTAIPDSYWGWIAGIRIERENDHGPSLTQTLIPLAPPITTKDDLDSTLYSVKGGVSGSIPLSSDGNFRLFGNIMLLGGVFNVNQITPGFGPSTDTVAIGPDLSVGFQYSLSPTFVLDARYRGVIEFFVNPQSSSLASLKTGISQGPMLALNIKF